MKVIHYASGDHRSVPGGPGIVLAMALSPFGPFGPSNPLEPAKPWQ